MRLSEASGSSEPEDQPRGMRLSSVLNPSAGQGPAPAESPAQNTSQGMRLSAALSTPTAQPGVSSETGRRGGPRTGRPYDFGGQEMRATDPTWADSFVEGYMTVDSPSQNVADILSDQAPEIDPATGLPMTFAERHGQRRASEERRRDQYRIDDEDKGRFTFDPNKSLHANAIDYLLSMGDRAGHASAKFLGSVAREFTDPATVIAGSAGAREVGLRRLATLGGVGGAYEGAAGALEQLADHGEIVDPGAIAVRAGAGAVLTPGFDWVIRHGAETVRKGVQKIRDRLASPDEVAAEVDEAITAAAEEAGVNPDEARRVLFETIETPEGPIVAADLERVTNAPEVGLLNDLDPAPNTSGIDQAAPEVAPVDPVKPTPAAVDPVAVEARAAELERLARATEDPSIRQDLLRQAEVARADIAPKPAKLTPAERIAKRRIVRPEEDDLLTAIRKLGGIDTDIESDWRGQLSGLVRAEFGLPGIERPGKGKSLDQLAESLHDLGYIDRYDAGELDRLLDDARSGDPVYSRFVEGDRVMQEPDRFGADDAWAWEEPDAAIPDGVDFVIDTDMGTVVPARSMSGDDLARLIDEERAADEWFRREAGEHVPDGDILEYSAQAESGRFDGGVGSDGQAAGLASPAGRRPGLESEPRAPSGDGARVVHREVDELPAGLDTVRDPADVAHLVAPIRRDAQESVLAVVTDAEGRVLRTERLHRGTGDSAPFDPALVAGTASNTKGASQVWIAHNHPVGNPAQSDRDLSSVADLAELLRSSGVEFRGSVVVAPGSKRFSYVSPEGRATDDLPILPARRAGTAPVSERRLVGQASDARPVNTPEDARLVLDEMGGGREGVVLLDGEGRPIRFVEMSSDEMRNLRTDDASTGAARLFREMDETGASSFVVRADHEAARGNMAAFGQRAGRPMLDAVDGSGASSASKGENLGQSTFYSNPFLHGLGEMARNVRGAPGQSAAEAFSGGTLAGVSSDEEFNTPAWWSDVAFGAFGGLTVGQVARQTNLVGKGSILDNYYSKAGKWIERQPFIGRGPEEVREFKRQQRVMEMLIDRQTAEVGEQLLKNFSPPERAMIADLIENRGIVQGMNRVHDQAAALDNYLSQVGERLKALGMLPADMETGGYLHRYYAKHLGLGDQLFSRAKRQQGISGSYSIARGTDSSFRREFVSPGGHAVLDELGAIDQEILDIERGLRGQSRAADRAGQATVPNEVTDGEIQRRLTELKARRAELRKTEFVEYTGVQNGETRSFLFAPDEVPHIAGNDGRALGAIFENGPGLDAKPYPVADNIANLAETGRVWTPRATREDGQALFHRDWTKAERESWGEIQDAGYRYVRGMAEASHDLAIAEMFDKVSRRAEWVRSEPTEGFVEVPVGKIHKNSPLRKYGNLAGKHVRADVWASIRNYGRPPFAPGRAGQIYRAALNKWKLYKTVYNPVTHLNNTWSNVEMLLQAGYGPRSFADGVREMSRGEESTLFREARDNGLFGQDWASSLLNGNETGGSAALADLAQRLHDQPEIPDAELMTSAWMDFKHWWVGTKSAVGAASGPWRSGAALAKAAGDPVLAGLKTGGKTATAPLRAAAHAAQRAYRLEDEAFKMAVYTAERAKGASPADAVNRAQNLFFDYQDIPEAVKWIRDLPVGSPFITYTYKAAPAIARNAIQHPERMIALIAAYEAWNYGAILANQEEGEGMAPGEYWATVEAEETVSPAWERGRALWGAKNTLHVPAPDGYRLALGRAHALGNPFMSEAGGREKLPTAPYLANFWGSSAFGSSPLHSILDIWVNEDWKGKNIYDPGAPEEEKIRKAAAYLYQAWTPANVLTPGGYQQTRILEGLANDVRTDREAGEDPGIIAPVVDLANKTAAELGLETFTGLDRAGNEIRSRDALLASFGIKLRPMRFEQSASFERADLTADGEEVTNWIRRLATARGQNRIPNERLQEAIQYGTERFRENNAQSAEIQDALDLLRSQGRLNEN